MADSFFTLMSRAQSELQRLVARAEKVPAAAKGLELLVTTHAKVAAQLEAVLAAVRAPLIWSKPESDTWRARHNDLEVNIHRDAGTYYWTISSTWKTHGKTLDEAKEAIDQLLRPLK